MADRDATMKATLAEAVKLHGAGRYDEALAVLAADKAAERSATGQNLAGDILLKRGKPRDALKAFDAAIRLMPGAAEPYANRGAALIELGRLEEALAAEDKALRLRPDYAAAHFNRGNVMKALKRAADAVTAYDRALRARPAFAEARVNRGTALVDLKRPREALEDFNAALKLNPQYVAAHVGRGNALRELRLFDEGLAAVDAALRIAPDNLEAARLRAALLLSAGRHAEALAVADALTARSDAGAADHALRASVLNRMQRSEEALAAAEAAVRMAPDHDRGYVMLGAALADLGRHAEGLAALDTAGRHGASGAEYMHARAVALSNRDDPGEALAAFDAAFALEPDNAAAHKNRAYLRLAMGDWQEGWAEHEWRLRTPDRVGDPLPGTPDWQGEDLTGKRLLVYSEQGFGDAIQFVRYVRLIEARGGRVVLNVGEPLRRLFAANFPDIDVVDRLGGPQRFDYRVSLMSLPAIFRTTLENVPPAVPYLVADAEREAKWRARIGEEGFRVGIVWQGNTKYRRDRERSIRLVEYAPLANVPGVRLISLQSAGGAGQLKALPAGMRVEELGEEIVDNPDGFREVAAAMMNLDHLIMSDTGPTHLAGALGRPVWLALPYHADWRWMSRREDTPWYPTMRLFRQQAAGDWRGVFERMAGELADLAAAKK